AQETFEDWIKQTAFKSPSRQLILNATGKVESEPDNIKQLISHQLTSPVRWRDCVNTLKEMNLTDILEVGPGRVLSGLVRLNHISGSTRIFNINNLRGLAHFKG
ncbi:ACP S-malonyltransferase, partial [PVC group bacterium]|nr:ACP S-malonyltransferase [PVC group bacterium]